MSSVPQTSPLRRSSRLWLRFLLLIALILAAPLCWFAIDRLRAHWRLEDAYAQADRLDPEWRERPQLSDEENGALQVLAALKHLPKAGYEAEWKLISLPSGIDRSKWQMDLEWTITDLPGNVSLNAQQVTAVEGESNEWQAAVE